LRIARRSTPWESSLEQPETLTVERRAVMQGQLRPPTDQSQEP
jgi:hypothetical protein